MLVNIIVLYQGLYHIFPQIFLGKIHPLLLESHLDPLKVGACLDWDPKNRFDLNYIHRIKEYKDYNKKTPMLSK